MGYEDYISNQNKLIKTQVIWSQVKESPERYKSAIEKNAKIIFYDDLFNKLPEEYRSEIGNSEELKKNLKICFKIENVSYNFIKSYDEFVIKKFETGYLWNKITTDKKYDSFFKEFEFIDKNVDHKSVAIMYPKMVEAIKKSYPKYFKTKRDVKKILETYFNNNKIEYSFISDEDEFDNYSSNVISKINNK